MFVSERIVLAQIDVIEAFLIGKISFWIVNTGLEDGVIMLLVLNSLIQVAAVAAFYWIVFRVHEEVARA